MIYDKYIFGFSGGKDCTAAVLALLEEGIPASKMELWHHEIDGREGEQLMDWKITPGYCRAFAAHLNIHIYFSWKVGGFEREMLRDHARTAPTSFENEKGEIITIGGTGGKESTRLKFPQVSGDLSVRWCSAYLKIDVMAAAIRNQDRFRGLKVCIVTGERAEESTKRANYADLEIDRSDARNSALNRYVDHIRPVKHWAESKVWEIIERWHIRVHPCYYMGWGRCSCQFCIFGDANQFASAYAVTPATGDKVIAYEERFGVTIKRGKSIRQLITEGTPYAGITGDLIALANSEEYTLPIYMEAWVLPIGAFAKTCGPS